MSKKYHVGLFFNCYRSFEVEAVDEGEAFDNAVFEWNRKNTNLECEVDDGKAEVEEL